MNFSLKATHCVVLGLCISAATVSALHAQSDLHMAPALDSSSAVKTQMSTMALESVTSDHTLHIVVGQSLILRDVNALRRIYVGNPAILQTFTSSPQEVVVTAKAGGVSSLVIWDTDDHSTMYNVHADVDASGLSQSIAAAYPNSAVVVNGTEDRIALTGTVPTTEIADGVLKLAGDYSHDLVNSIRVVPVHGKQVQLKLRIAEVDRTKLEQFGINYFGLGANNGGALTTQQFPTSAPASAITNPLTFFFYNAGHNMGVTIQDLENANLLQILAEPTLTTMSGKAASFLSGGEFPVPVVQGGTGNSTAITIMFRPYGVKVDFTPEVNADGTIHLKIAPEVSTLDYGNAVNISGFTVPALATRRSETEVEIKDGQSFVLSGLLNHTTTDALAKIPGIGNIPVLGQLFRSKSLNHAVTELVIMVTASVVDPLNEPAAKPDAPLPPKFVVPNLDLKQFDDNVKKFEPILPDAK